MFITRTAIRMYDLVHKQLSLCSFFSALLARLASVEQAGVACERSGTEFLQRECLAARAADAHVDTPPRA